MIRDTFFDNSALLAKLHGVYAKHGKIIIAYDFDDTVAPTYLAQSCEMVCKLLRKCKPYAHFVCFTSNPEVETKVRPYLKKHKIPYDTINANVESAKAILGEAINSKVYYNIFLDDKAGLGQAYDILCEFIESISMAKVCEDIEDWC